MPPMTLPTHWWHWERQKEYVRELFNIFDAHLLAQWLPLLWPPALWEVEMPPINAKCNNQPGAKRKPTKRAWGWGNDLKSKNNKQPAMWGQCKDYVNAMPMPMQCLHKATANTIHPSMVWGNYNFRINQQEEMWEKFFPTFVVHLWVLWPLATANASTAGENQQSTAKSSNQTVCVKREWMKESEYARKTNNLQTYEGRKQNNRTTINNQPPHAGESTNNNQPTASSMLSGILNSCMMS